MDIFITWANTPYRGDDELGALLQERHDRITDLFTEIQTHLRSNKIAEAEASCHQLSLLLADLPMSQASPDSRNMLAEILFGLGSFYLNLTKTEQAEETYELALSTWQELSAAQPDDTHLLARIAGCKNHLGILYLETGSLEQASVRFHEALSLREKLLLSNPQDEENLVYLGGTLCNLGHLASDQNDPETALAWFNKSIDILDRCIPECDCGCRDLHADMMAFVTGRTSPIAIAQQFLRNALQGRATILAGQSRDLRYRHVRCSEADRYTVVSILTPKLGASCSTPLDQDETLQELKRELLDAVTFASGTVILDLRAVNDMDDDGVTLLLHLRGRLVGAGEWPLLCGLSRELRASTPSVSWDDYFDCYESLDAALAGVDG